MSERGGQEFPFIEVRILFEAGMEVARSVGVVEETVEVEVEVGWTSVL